MSIILEIIKKGSDASYGTDIDSYESHYEDGCVVGLGFEDVNDITNEKDGDIAIEKFSQYVEKNYAKLNIEIKEEGTFLLISSNFKETLISTLFVQFEKMFKQITTPDVFAKEINSLTSFLKNRDDYYINYEDLDFFGTFEEFILSLENDFKDTSYEIIGVIEAF